MRLLFSDGEDDRVVAAVAELARTRTARPIVFGDHSRIAAIAKRLGVSLDGVEIIEALPPGEVARHVGLLAARRGLAAAAATRLMQRPLYAAFALLVDGVADAVVAGVTSRTRDVLVACEMWLSLRPELAVASSSFVMATDRGPIMFADCEVNPTPTADQLADITCASADAARQMLHTEPRVAMLSFSTHGSATHPDVGRMVRATELVRARRPDLVIDGELQGDAALDPRVASLKLDEPGAPLVAGSANVLVFPDLGAASIGCTLVRTLAHANAYGAFVQGYDHPIVKLSRGSTTEEIVGTCALLAQLEITHALRAEAS